MMTSMLRTKSQARIRSQDEAILTALSSSVKPIRNGLVVSSSLVGFDPFLVDTDGSESEGESRDHDGAYDRGSPSPPLTPGQTACASKCCWIEHRKNMSLSAAEMSSIMDKYDERNHMPLQTALAEETEKKPKPKWGARIQNKLTGSFHGRSELTDSPSNRARAQSLTQESSMTTLTNRLSLAPPSKFLRRRAISDSCVKPATLDLSSVQIPVLAKPSPTSFLRDSGDPMLRTSEHEPSTHQVKIPDLREVMMNTKICGLMDSRFDFVKLVGKSNLELKRFCTLKTKSTNLADEDRATVQRLLECSENITVEGYANKSVQVAVFDIPTRSQIVVAVRGTNDQQIRPLRGKSCGALRRADQSVSVVSSFRDTWDEIEAIVCRLVDKASDSNPFATIIFTGHSYGGALAQLAAVRYAASRSVNRVAALAFSSPKVGGTAFRLLANSISNLKVFRIETKDDAIANAPLDFSSKCEHIGHSIVLGGKPFVAAYRYDRFKPQVVPNPFRIFAEARAVKTYYTALQKTKPAEWLEFIGIGDGVCGQDDEKRQMV